ncbi:CDP-alcohol phosphatidyltransferase family protein [Micromonospora sp. CPCC 205371]|nr:CDP-alcohol phosphatidyltransferase family protein [Micromonospora sp. CPCC 205371]
MLGVVVGERPELADQLRAAGARDAVTVADLDGLAKVASAADEPLLLCADDLVAHTAVLRHLATSPVGPTVALLLQEGAADVREERGRLVPGPPTAAFGGALRVGADDLPALVAAARGATPGGLDALPAALFGTGTTIFTHRVRLLVATRASTPPDRAAAEAKVAAVDADTAELRLAVKEKDDFFATYFVSTWSPWLTRWSARLGLGPSAVTAISVAFAVAAAALFTAGGRPALVAGAVLLYLGFVLDCVDGQVARYTRHFSAFGGWLDTMADRTKEYLVYAGLAIGATRADLGDGWALAIAAITLQTVRHKTDAWYGALHDEAASRSAAATGRLSSLSNRVQADRGSIMYWLKRTVVFPIGERWAVMALAAALFDQRVALLAVLVWGGLAAAYTLLLRAMRARAMRVPVRATVTTTPYRDGGVPARSLGRRRIPPLAAAVVAALGAAALLLVPDEINRWSVLAAAVALVLIAGLPAASPHEGALDWLVPAALRAVEFLFVIAVGAAFDVPRPLVYGLLMVLALHHYDLTARLEKRLGAPPLQWLSLGWDARMLVLAIGAAAGFATATFGALTTYLAVVLLSDVVRTWALPGRSGQPSR